MAGITLLSLPHPHVSLKSEKHAMLPSPVLQDLLHVLGKSTGEVNKHDDSSPPPMGMILPCGHGCKAAEQHLL